VRAYPAFRVTQPGCGEGPCPLTRPLRGRPLPRWGRGEMGLAPRAFSRPETHVLLLYILHRRSAFICVYLWFRPAFRELQ
jgi:hypothetical protein